jgi:phosphohistidine phosphatase
MLKLYLLRHGKAANPERYDHDYDRPLNKKGIVQINQIGYKLEHEGHRVSQIISSSAKRTEQTTVIVNHYLACNNVDYHEDLYLAGHGHIFDALQKLSNSSEVLYVGHNFGISDIASYLSGENISMSTGMLVELTFDFDDWQMLSKESASEIMTYAPKILIP